MVARSDPTKPDASGRSRDGRVGRQHGAGSRAAAGLAAAGVAIVSRGSASASVCHLTFEGRNELQSVRHPAM